MICPVCKTNNALNAKNPNAEFCVQCGSDIHIHHLLRDAEQEIKMQEDRAKQKQEMPGSKKMDVFISLDSLSSLFLMIAIVFMLAAGLHFFSFLSNRESQHPRPASGLAELQTMNSIIKEELDLIVAERAENQALRTKLAASTNPAIATPAAKIQGAAQ